MAFNVDRQHTPTAPPSGLEADRSTHDSADSPPVMTRREALSLMANTALLLGAAPAVMAKPKPGNQGGHGGSSGGASSGDGWGSQKPPQAIRDAVDKYRASTNAPGCAVITYQDGQEEIWCCGEASPGHPVAPASVFGIGSVTKTFTSTLLALQVIDGRMALDDPVTKYLPAAVGQHGHDINHVTLKMLATHTSGIGSATGPDTDLVFLDKAPTDRLIQWWENWTHHGPSIGTHYQYSNTGMITLAYAVANASYGQLLQRTITAPLRMGTTAPWKFLPKKTVPPLVDGHDGPDLRAFPTHDSDLNSSPQDMLLYLKAQLGLSEKNTALGRAIALTHQVQYTPPARARTPVMGLGWQIAGSGSSAVYSKDGGTSTGGCGCWIGHCPGKGFGLVFMANVFKSPGESPASFGASLFQKLYGTSTSTNAG